MRRIAVIQAMRLKNIVSDITLTHLKYKNLSH